MTETSLIVHWLTPDLGRIATVARGARRAKSPFRGKLDLFFDCEFTFARSRRSDLHALREVSVRDMHTALRRELGWVEQAAYAMHSIEQCTETETPLPEIFALFRGLIDHLPVQPPLAQTVLAWEMKLLQELGQMPDLESSSLTAGSRQILGRLARLDWPVLSTIKPAAGQVQEMQQFLHGFLIHHLGKLPRGRSTALFLD